MSDVNSLPAQLVISSMAANSSLTITIEGNQNVSWGIGTTGESGISIAGSSVTSGVLQSFSVNDAVVTLTNGNQSQNWTIGLSVLSAQGVDTLSVITSVAPAPASIEFYGNGPAQTVAASGQTMLSI